MSWMVVKNPLDTLWYDKDTYTALTIIINIPYKSRIEGSKRLQNMQIKIQRSSDESYTTQTTGSLTAFSTSFIFFI